MPVLGRLRGELAKPRESAEFPTQPQDAPRNPAWRRFAPPVGGLVVGFLAGAMIFGRVLRLEQEAPPSPTAAEPEWAIRLASALEDFAKKLEAPSNPSGAGEWSPAGWTPASAPAAAAGTDRGGTESQPAWEHKVVVLSAPSLDAGDPGKEQWLQFTDVELLLQKEEAQGWTLVEAIPRGSRVGLVLRRAR